MGQTIFWLLICSLTEPCDKYKLTVQRDRERVLHLIDSQYIGSIEYIENNCTGVSLFINYKIIYSTINDELRIIIRFGKVTSSERQH